MSFFGGILAAPFNLIEEGVEAVGKGIAKGVIQAGKNIGKAAEEVAEGAKEAVEVIEDVAEATILNPEVLNIVGDIADVSGEILGFAILLQPELAPLLLPLSGGLQLGGKALKGIAKAEVAVKRATEATTVGGVVKGLAQAVGEVAKATGFKEIQKIAGTTADVGNVLGDIQKFVGLEAKTAQQVEELTQLIELEETLETKTLIEGLAKTVGEEEKQLIGVIEVEEQIIKKEAEALASATDIINELGDRLVEDNTPPKSKTQFISQVRNLEGTNIIGFLGRNKLALERLSAGDVSEIIRIAIQVGNL